MLSLRCHSIGKCSILVSALLAAMAAFLAGRTLSAKAHVPAVGDSYKIPVGTALPISLEHTLSTKGSAKDQAIEGRLMQDVQLPNGDVLPAGAKIRGAIVDSSPARKAGTASITFRFTSLEVGRDSIPLTVGLRAMAPYSDVQHARTPYQDSSGSPAGWASTLQIGGDIRFGDGGKVTNGHHRVVGQATKDAGVLAILEDDPGSPCDGWPNAAPGPQAIWVFSADACGLYDLKDMRIAQAGNKAPLGEIKLVKKDGDINIMKSSTLLLRVVK